MNEFEKKYLIADLSNAALRMEWVAEDYKKINHSRAIEMAGWVNTLRKWANELRENETERTD